MTLEELTDIVLETVTETKADFDQLLEAGQEIAKLAIILTRILGDESDPVDITGDATNGTRSIDLDRMVHTALLKIRAPQASHT